MIETYKIVSGKYDSLAAAMLPSPHSYVTPSYRRHNKLIGRPPQYAPLPTRDDKWTVESCLATKRRRILTNTVSFREIFLRSVPSINPSVRR